MISAGNFVFTGIKATHRVHKSTTVNTYLKPLDVVVPGEYRSMATAEKGLEDTMGTNGEFRVACSDFARLHVEHRRM